MIGLLCVACAGLRPVDLSVSDSAAEVLLPAEPAVDQDRDPHEQPLSRQESNELAAAAAAFEPLVVNLIAALLERRHDGYMRDFDTLWKKTNADSGRFYAMAEAARTRLGSCSGFQLSEIRRHGEYVEVHSRMQCSQSDEPLRIRLVVLYDGSVPGIVFHSFSEPGAAGDEHVQ